MDAFSLSPRMAAVKMAAGWSSLLVLLKLLCSQSVAVPPGFSNFLNSVDELLHDVERLTNTNNPTVVDNIVARLQCAVDTTHQLLQRVDNYGAARDLSTDCYIREMGKPGKTYESLLCSHGYREQQNNLMEHECNVSRKTSYRCIILQSRLIRSFLLFDTF